MPDSAPRPKSPDRAAPQPLPVICDVDREAADHLRALLIAAGTRYATKAGEARRSVVFAWEDSDRQAQPPALLSPAHARVRAQIWTSRLARTAYALYVTGPADADVQLDCLSNVLGRSRDAWTIKPPRGWSGYGWPRRHADTYLDNLIDKPWGREYRVYDDALTDVWLLSSDRDCPSSIHRHPRKDTALLNVSGNADLKVVDGQNPHVSRAATDLMLVVLETPRDKFDLPPVTGAAGGAAARRRSRTTSRSACHASVGRRPRTQHRSSRAGRSALPRAAVGAVT